VGELRIGGRDGLVVLSVMALSACAGEADAPGPEPIVELAAEPEIRIGSVDDPTYALTWFRSMEVAPDGTMYTLHPMDQNVRVFAADGSAMGEIGRRGSGPGEFENAAAMDWVGDTLWVLDYDGYRFNQFSKAGELLGSFSVPFQMGDDPTAPFSPW
jgi:hypothetical protein